MTLLNQLAAVYATGNQAVLLHTTAKHLPSDFPASLLTKTRIVEQQQDCRELTLAMCEHTQLTSSLLTALAARDGAIVPVVMSNVDEVIPLWRLVSERAVCINTTAAGGNASLMSMDLSLIHI